MTASFFVQVNKQSTADGVLNVAQSMIKKLQLMWLPIGGNIEDAYDATEPEGWNNKFACEAMRSSFAAIFEKVINARDAEIALWQEMGWFKTDPQNSTEALKEIADSYPKDGRHPNAAIFCVSRQPTAGKVNVLVGDHGIGVPQKLFGKTIMSLMKSNKSKNALMSGTYGCGGQAAMSHCGAMLIYSCSAENPEMVSWTIAARILPEDTNEHTYAYLVDAAGDVLTFNRSELDNVLLLEQLSAKGNLSLRQRLTNQSILPVESGTVIRCFDVPNINSDHWDNFERVREQGFGNELSIHLIAEQKNGSFGTENPKGLRQYLRERRVSAKALDGTDSIDMSAFYQEPLPILDGRATIEVFALDNKDQESMSPVASVLSKNDDTRPIFITINGQTHARQPIKWLLTNNKLDYLKGRLIIEINCDSMPRKDRSDCFASQREGIRDDFAVAIKDAVNGYLRSQSEPKSPLRRFNEKVRDRRLHSAVKMDDDRTRERIAKLFEGKVASALFKAFGFSALGNFRAKLLEKQQSGSLTEADWELTDQPQQLRFRTRTAQVGSGNYIVVNTDATDKFDPYLTISDLPSYMTHNPAGDQPLRNGRKAFNVTVAAGTPAGTSDYVSVKLDISVLVPNHRKLKLDAEIELPRNIAVVDPQSREVSQSGRTSTGDSIPAFEIKWGSAKDPSFAANLELGELEPQNVAGHYMHNAEGGIDVFLNADYPAYAAMFAEIDKRHGPDIAEEAKSLYSFAGAAQALQMDKMFVTDEEEDGLSQAVRHKIFASAMGTAAFIVPSLLENFSQQPMSSKSRKETDDEAA